MNKHIKKLLCAAVSLAMVSGAIVLPITASATPATWDANATSWKFDFGASDAVADDYIGVSADTKYSAANGYGFLGLENGFSLDSREDGWTMTQGYDLELENGKKADTVTTADDDFVATTTRTEKEQDYNSPIRFSVKVEKNTYYHVKVNLTRADASKEAKVSLFTEKRHQHLVDKPIPAEGLVYETNVYVHNNWSKNTSEYVDTQLSIAAAGDNVAISSIEITKTDQGKTLWVLTDSTGCQQTAPIPYFPLDHCQGIGSAMAKYIGEDWALVNEGESGLSSSAAANHWNNCKNDVKAGDVVWFQFGHNNERGQQVDELISSLNTYYADVKAKGANFLVVSPVERDTTGQYNNGTWSSTLSKYADAGSQWVSEKIAAGETDVAYLDLNTASVDFLNKVQKEIDEGRQAASLQSLGAATTRFYYYVSKYAGYEQDYTHPNDYGADNYAKIIVDLAKEKITAAAQAGATDAQKTEAAVLSSIFGDSTRSEEAVSVSEDIYKAGAAPNIYYPNQLAKIVLYDYPIIVSKVTFDNTNKPDQMTVKLVTSELGFKYGRGVIVIKGSDGQVKGTVKTTDTIDSVAGDTQTINFSDADTTFDAAAGDTFEAYVINITEGADSHDEDDVIISTKYTQNDMVDIKDYLLQGATDMENIEDFSTYDLTDGQSIIGKNGWSNPGGETFAFKQEGDLTFAHCETSGNGTFYPEKKFTAQSSGKLYCRLDVRYISGTFNLYFTDGTALNNWPAGRVVPLQIVTADGEVQVKLNNEKVATVNSGEWITYALTIDFDYGTYTLSVNGKTYESDFAAYQSNEVNLVPSNLSMIAFQNDKSINEYDVTNIVLATLNTAPLPDKTLTVASNDDTKGKVSIVKDGEAVEGKTATATMNSLIKAVAAPEEGFEFEKWVDKAGTTVSYSQEYEMRLHSDTELTAQFKEAVFDPITYAYKENFSALSTNTLKDNGWVSVNAQAYTTIQMDDDHGNYLRIAPGNDNSRGLLKDFGVNLADNYVVEMDLALTAGNDHDTNLSLYNAASTTSTTSGQSMNSAADKYVFDLGAPKNSTTWTINRTEGDTVTIPAGTWVHLTVIVKDGTVSYIIANGDSVLKKGTTTAEGGVDLKGLHLRQGRYNGVTQFDNIRIYTADQYIEPEVPPTEYSVAIDGGKISVASPAAGTCTALYAVYKDSALVGVKPVDVTFTEAAKQSVDIPQNDFAGDSFKVMLWKTLSGAEPLCAPATGTIEG